MSLATVPVRIRPTIILFGDSITEFAFGQNGQVGWAGLLSSAYSRRADVLSRGFSGYNTRHALGVMQSIFGVMSRSEGEDGVYSDSGESFSKPTTKTPLLFCTVFFGANDASLPSARQHLSIDEYDKNMRQIITNIRKVIGSGDASSHTQEHSNNNSTPMAPPIILFTPTPVSPKAWDHYCTVTSPRPLSPRSNERSKEYGLRVKKIGKEMDCTVVDTFSLFQC